MRKAGSAFLGRNLFHERVFLSTTIPAEPLQILAFVFQVRAVAVAVFSDAPDV